jgi:hypothetical protein
MTNDLDLNALRKLASLIDKDPSILFTDELSFLRKSLSVYGDLKSPKGSETSKSTCNHASHDHDHSHEHSHDHTHTTNTAHDGHEDGEEDDPDRIPVDPEPYLPVPTGGEGILFHSKKY